MYILNGQLNLNEWQFAQRKYLPYEAKLELSAYRIRQWYDYWNGQVYVAFSGGLDSVVLLHMVRKILGDYIPAVFSNTGLEFPEIIRFARSAPGEFVEIKPLDKKTGKRITYRDVILRAGYPLVSKETADKLYKLRHGNLSPRYRNYMLNGDERGRFGMLPKKWRFLIEAPFEISGKCCDLLKKGPLKEYEKQTGRKPFIGVTQDEGFRREHQYAKTGCNVYDGSTIKSQPLGFWTRQDILRYIIENDVEICSVYGNIISSRAPGTDTLPCYCTTGEQRTGCMYCAMGAHLETGENRFQRLAVTHPRCYAHCMKPLSEGGLGMAVPLDYMGIPYKPAIYRQTSILQYAEEDFCHVERYQNQQASGGRL